MVLYFVVNNIYNCNIIYKLNQYHRYAITIDIRQMTSELGSGCRNFTICIRCFRFLAACDINKHPGINGRKQFILKSLLGQNEFGYIM